MGAYPSSSTGVWRHADLICLHLVLLVNRWKHLYVVVQVRSEATQPFAIPAQDRVGAEPRPAEGFYAAPSKLKSFKGPGSAPTLSREATARGCAA